MNQIELHEKLGNQILLIEDKNVPPDVKIKQIEAAKAISSLAKQMINNADVILRAEKLINSGSLKNSVIKALIGGVMNEKKK